MEAINVTFDNLGQGISALLTDKTKLATGIAGLTLLALGVYSTREGVRIAGRTFDRWFGTPSLVCILKILGFRSAHLPQLACMQPCAASAPCLAVALRSNDAK